MWLDAYCVGLLVLEVGLVDSFYGWVLARFWMFMLCLLIDGLELGL